jgi:hypothetical protein
MTQAPEIRGFFDEQTNTITYLVGRLPPAEKNGVSYLRIPVRMKAAVRPG